MFRICHLYDNHFCFPKKKNMHGYEKLRSEIDVYIEELLKIALGKLSV